MIWKKSGFGRDGKMKNTTTFRKDHEYIMACYKIDKKLNKIDELPDFQGEYSNPDNDSRGAWLSGSISRADYASDPDHQFFYTVVSPSGKKLSRQFEITKEDFDKLNKDHRISWGKSGDSVPRQKIFLSEERSVTSYSVLLNKGTTTEGTKEVSAILGRDCAKLRPKPVKLIQTLIQLGVKNDNAVVVDFFAGTGTTGHAVRKFAKKVSKNIQYILCTNDENKICSNYCYPRVRKIMELGYKDENGKKIKPLGGSLKYFKTVFVKDASNKDDFKIRITKECTEMLCLREGVFDEIQRTDNYRIFKQVDKYLAVYFSLDRKTLLDLKKELNRIDGAKVLYCFTLNPLGLDKSDFMGWKNVSLEPIPQKILDVYKQIYEY
jgi:adenine-specific DNA-methyltransferase